MIMIRRGHTNGFTVVELLIVIVVLALLSTMIAVMYGNVQMQARDTKARDQAAKMAEAMELWSAHNQGKNVMGGHGSTLPPVGGDNPCPDGTGEGYAVPGQFNPNYKCTFGDVLVAGGYLNQSFFDDLQPNMNSIWNPNGSKQSAFIYTSCAGKRYLLYSLERPNAADTTSIAPHTSSGACNWNSWMVTDAGMRSAIQLEMSY